MPEKRLAKLKVAISYPPLESPMGVPLLAQNRQFQWFNTPTYIYPMVPAYAATLLSKNGFEVIWDDSISEGRSYRDWLHMISRSGADLIAIETKTPVVKRHWEIIRELKGVKNCPLVVLMGDHVTAYPKESMENCPVDFVLTGGDYDFLLLNVCKWLSNETGVLEPGIWYRDGAAIKNTGPFKLDHDLNCLPEIDRDLTGWRLYSAKNGNYRRLPGTYTMAGRDCWWGKCSFCSWTTLYPGYRVRSPESLLNEVGRLVNDYGIKEIMDDTGTFPTGGWLRSFSQGMIDRGYNRRVSFSCNMRFGAVGKNDYRLMKKAGFRLLLFGLESANQTTLERLCKGVTVAEIIESCRNARAAGLFPHITLMFGYPWETLEEAENTIKLGRWLLKKGYAWTVQATVVIPYPGTPLYGYCKENGLLATGDWDSFDMRAPVIKTIYRNAEVKRLVRKIYSTAFSPEFLVRRFLAVRDIEDVKYFFRAANKVFGHLMDFGRLKAGQKPCG